MKKIIKTSDEVGRSRPPARTPEARENEMISLAIGLAEKQLREGTASSQVITHFLKLGSTREAIEKETMTLQKDLIRAKTESIQSAQRYEEIVVDALKAMRSYTGNKEAVSDE